VYYVARELPERDLTLMRILNELHLQWPFYGARKLTRKLQNQRHEVGRRHVTTLMRRMGMETIYRKPRTSIPAPLSAVYPYLLTGLKIERPNHVWAADLTYLPMAHGFQYLVTIIDVGSRMSGPGTKMEVPVIKHERTDSDYREIRETTLEIRSLAARRGRRNELVAAGEPLRLTSAWIASCPSVDLQGEPCRILRVRSRCESRDDKRKRSWSGSSSYSLSTRAYQTGVGETDAVVRDRQL
jgi:hypothetical protein